MKASSNITGAGSCRQETLLAHEYSNLKILYRKAKGRLMTRPEMPPIMSRAIAHLPIEGEGVSLELALNSRCSSDYDNDPEVAHWGMFDVSARLSDEQIGRIARLAGRSRTLQTGTEIDIEGNKLVFLVDNTIFPETRRLLMIDSGMQQQAALLACAALGMGAQLSNMGLDGTERPPKSLATVSIVLDPLKPSFRGSFWTASPPDQERPWLPGNLPDPQRNGAIPLVTLLETFPCNMQRGVAANCDDISQLLWAARGRTPHFRNSVPWGLTIPTWQGIQNLTSVYAAAGSTLSVYVNWHHGRPTHALHPVAESPKLAQSLNGLFPAWNCFIILATGDSHARGLWEIGYQVLNLQFQAAVLGIACQTIVMTDEHRAVLADLPIETPIVIFALRALDQRIIE